MVAKVSRAVATFRALHWSTGTLAHLDVSRTIVRATSHGELALPDGETHYVYALGAAELEQPRGGAYSLRPSMFASVAGACRVAGSALIVSRVGYRGVFLLGGPLETTGRLRYIDGCTDSLLLPPAVRGDPCLNHLHIPAGTRQTRHTHPSVRVGIIVRGSGRCVTAEGEHRLEPGLPFVIEEDLLHAFHTDDESLDVVVYHPDSDTGPTHEDHPMKNRTILE